MSFKAKADVELESRTLPDKSPVDFHDVPYEGDGTQDSPYVVTWLEHDAESPYNFPLPLRWAYLLTYAVCMMSGTFSISAFTSGYALMIKEFNTTAEVLALGQFLFLLGLAFGSLIWPSLGDLFSRRRMATLTLLVFTAFSAGVAGARNLTTILVCRFFAGFFASYMQTLGPASCSAVFLPRDLAVPFSTSAIAPFLGPSLGPLVGGWVVQETGSWRNINWVATGFAGVVALMTLAIPDIYGPSLLRKRAVRLSESTGHAYVSRFDLAQPVLSPSQEAKKFLLNPLVWHFKEPIALLLSAYVAFLYGILNLFFSAFPRIYRIERGYSQGIAGLPYIGLCVGYFAAVPVTLLCGKPYIRRLERDGKAEPEWRLIFAMVAAVLLPISLFWLGWTAAPSVSWVSPVFAGGLFGFAQIGITMSILVYYSDTYKHRVATIFQGMNFLRFSFGAVFPLFTTQMYEALGTAWACSLLGFLLLVFLPAPFIFFKYGAAIRSKSKIAIS